MRRLHASAALTLTAVMVGCTIPVAEQTAEETVAAPEVREQTVVIRSIGDILIHSDVYNTARSLSGGNGYDFEPMFAPVREYLLDADLTTANMEVPVAGEEYGLSGYPQFNSPPEIIDALAAVGVDVVNHATNHTVDRGADGAVASVENIRSRGVVPVGAYTSWEDKAEPVVVDVDGVKVGFLAYSYGTNGLSVAEGREYVVSLIDPAEMSSEIAALDADVDFTVTMLHVGEEYSPLPVESQESAVSAALDAGADLVLGGHPHVLEPFKRVDASRAVWWSHGNFLHGQHDEATKVGGIGEFSFVITREDGAVTSVALDEMRLMPVYTVGPPISYDHKVIPLADAGDYIDVDAWFAELRDRMGPDVEVVEYL